MMAVLLLATVAACSTPSAGPPTPAGSTGSGPHTAAAVPPKGQGIGPVFVEPGAGMTPVYRFMAGATRTITVTMYELVDATAEHILAAAAARGVRVRVLLDAAREEARNRPAMAYLAAHHVDAVFAPRQRIVHQKTICVDDQACLVMTLNLVAADYASTRDVAVEDRDRSDVAAIETTFAADYAGLTSPPASAGDHLLWSPGSEATLRSIIAGARHTLLIENEEMASPAITSALEAVARRGVNVEICMTAQPAYTAALRQIARAGARVRLFPDRPGDLYIHEKLVLADPGSPRARAAVGSINFSSSSLERNRELDLEWSAGVGRSAMSSLAAAFGRDFAEARPDD